MDNLLSRNKVLSRIEKKVDIGQTSLSSETLSSTSDSIMPILNWLSLLWVMFDDFKSKLHQVNLLKQGSRNERSQKSDDLSRKKKRAKQQEQYKSLFQPPGFPNWTYFSPQQDFHPEVS